jgi:hypothetical protein
VNELQGIANDGQTLKTPATKIQEGAIIKMPPPLAPRMTPSNKNQSTKNRGVV